MDGHVAYTSLIDIRTTVACLWLSISSLLIQCFHLVLAPGRYVVALQLLGDMVHTWYMYVDALFLGDVLLLHI